MAVSSLDKDVATRLFRMLAVNEQAADAIKRDHASYAKMSLLTQQAQLLQHQAKTVIDKCEAKAIKFQKVEEGAEAPGDTRLAMSEEYDEGAKRLCSMLAVSESTIATISIDHAASARLSLLAEQVGLLQEQAKQAVNDAALNKLLSEIGMSSRTVPGSVYYHYTQNGRHVLSRIANDEWDNYDEFHGKYLYDYDFTFRKLHGDVKDTEWCAAVMPMPQGLYMPQLGMSQKINALNVEPTPPTTHDMDAEQPADSPALAAKGTLADAAMRDAPPLPKPVCSVQSRW